MRRAARSLVGSVSDGLPSAKQCENQGVDPGCDWAVGVGLRRDSELVPKRTRDNQTEKGGKASGQKGWRYERIV